MNLVSVKFIEEIYVEIILCLIYFGLHRNSGQTFLLRFTEPVSSIGIAVGAITLNRECENKYWGIWSALQQTAAQAFLSPPERSDIAQYKLCNVI